MTNVAKSTILSILKDLPLEDRVWMIEKPHIRTLVEERLSTELSSGNSRQEMCITAKKVVTHLRKQEISADTL